MASNVVLRRGTDRAGFTMVVQDAGTMSRIVYPSCALVTTSSSVAAPVVVPSVSVVT